MICERDAESLMNSAHDGLYRCSRNPVREVVREVLLGYVPNEMPVDEIPPISDRLGYLRQLSTAARAK